MKIVGETLIGKSATLLCIGTFALVIWLKYDAARRREDQTEHKADIETLFGGEK